MVAATSCLPDKLPAPPPRPEHSRPRSAAMSPSCSAATRRAAIISRHNAAIRPNSAGSQLLGSASAPMLCSRSTTTTTTVLCAAHASSAAMQSRLPSPATGARTAADAVARNPPPRSVDVSRHAATRRVASAPQRSTELCGAGAARPVLMAELYRLGCLVDPTLAAVTDDDDNGRAQASPAAAAQPPQPQPQRTVFLVLPPDDTLSPDDVPTAARADAHRPRSAAAPSRAPQSVDLRPLTPDGNGRPQTAAPLGALGRGLRSVPPAAACAPVVADATAGRRQTSIPAPRPPMRSPPPAPTTKAPPLTTTTPPEPGLAGLSNQQYRTATFGRRPGGSSMWVWPPVHRSSVQPISEWTIEPAEPPPPAQHGQSAPPPSPPVSSALVPELGCCAASQRA